MSKSSTKGAKGFGKGSGGKATGRCQKCNQFGHWTFECTSADVEYKPRPARPQNLKNPHKFMRSMLGDEEPPESKTKNILFDDYHAEKLDGSSPDSDDRQPIRVSEPLAGKMRMDEEPVRHRRIGGGEKGGKGKGYGKRGKYGGGGEASSSGSRAQDPRIQNGSDYHDSKARMAGGEIHSGFYRRFLEDDRNTTGRSLDFDHRRRSRDEWASVPQPGEGKKIQLLPKNSRRKLSKDSGRRSSGRRSDSEASEESTVSSSDSSESSDSEDDRRPKKRPSKNVKPKKRSTVAATKKRQREAREEKERAAKRRRRRAPSTSSSSSDSS